MIFLMCVDKPTKHLMDLIIFLKAMGNVFFAALLFLALTVTTLYYAIFIMLQSIKRVSLHRAKFIFRKA
jgi:hypothetical protein